MSSKINGYAVRASSILVGTHLTHTPGTTGLKVSKGNVTPNWKEIKAAVCKRKNEFGGFLAQKAKNEAQNLKAFRESRGGSHTG